MKNTRFYIAQIILITLLYIGVALQFIIPREDIVQPETITEAEEDSDNFTYTSTFVLEVPNHMRESHYEGYTKVYGDEETDRAVYVKDNYAPEVNLPNGAEVKMGEYDAVVIRQDYNGFTIEIPVLARHGMSGTIITYKDVPVGFVSKAEGLYEIYCVFL